MAAGQLQQIQRFEPGDVEKVAASIEAAVAGCGVNAISKLPAFMQAVQLATGITQLRAALTDRFMNATVMPLQGAKLGFLTDRDRNKDGSRGPGYDIAIVRDCTIEAMLRGFSIVGNEFNIIAGGFYGTKAGWERKVSEYPGLFDLQYQAGVPHLVGDSGALVPYVAKWTLNGVKMSLECTQTKDVDLRIPVRINAGMGVDAAIGKATRKLMFRIYQRIAGSAFGAMDGEVGDDAAINTTGETAEGRRSPLDRVVAQAAQQQAQAQQAQGNGGGGEARLTIDRERLFAMLGDADERWLKLRARVDAWDEMQALGAMAYLSAIARDISATGEAPEMPAHLRLDRQAGEEG